MRKTTLLVILGILVFITPLLGIPRSFKEQSIFALGAMIILLALLFRLDERRRERKQEDLSHREHGPSELETHRVNEHAYAQIERTE
jgi:hypothetical protein